MFKELFDAVIDEKHGGFKPTDKYPAPDLDADKVGYSFRKVDVPGTRNVLPLELAGGLPFPKSSDCCDSPF